MIEISHDFYLFYKTLLSLVLTIGSLLGEGLHCVVLSVFDFFSEVNRSEVTLTDFLLGLELLMKTPLVDLRFQDLSALLEIKI